MPSYILAGQPYATKKAITDRCRQISETLGTVGAQSHDFLLALLSHHHEWEEKQGAGIERIDVRPNPEWPGQRTFYLVRVDGSEIDISWTKAISDIPTGRKQQPNALKDFKAAARQSIANQIAAFRANHWRDDLICPVMGAPILPGQSHVDHAPPDTFDHLLFSCCQHYDINPLRVEVGSRGGLVPFFVDRDFDGEWQEWHQLYATLRFTSAEGNLRQKKGSPPQWETLF